MSVKLEGSMPQADALAVVAASNGFLFASRFESFGLAPLEAAAKSLGAVLLEAVGLVLGHDSLGRDSTEAVSVRGAVQGFQ